MIVLVGLMGLMSACVKDPEWPQQLHFSVLGDSYSTFKGYVDPETNDLWECYDSIGVTDVSQMWWHQVATETNWVMDVNNSFSGSLICNMNVAGYFGPYSFIHRMDHLGDPDVIFIFGGTNDVWDEAPLGDYVYADWTEEQLCTIRPATAYMLDWLKQRHPKARIYFMIDLDLCPGGIPDETREAFIESMHAITSHYGVVCIDLHYVHKTSWHPNARGHASIARQLIDLLRVEFNV